MENLSQLVEGGAIGVALASLILVGVLIKLMFKFFGNHMKHSTEMLITLKDTINELREFLMKQNGKK